MSPGRARLAFLVLNLLMWGVMTVVLVVVPDTLERWMSLELARIVGWAIASGLWVVVLQQQWRTRLSPLSLFSVQVLLWVTAALVALWISEASRPPTFLE